MNFNNNNNNWNNNPYGNPMFNNYQQPVAQQPQMQQQGLFNPNVQRPQMQQMQPMVQPQQQTGGIPFPVSNDPNEASYEKVLVAVLKNGLALSRKNTMSPTKGYICTFKSPTFGLTFNLEHNLEHRHLQPYVYHMNEATISNGGYGKIIDGEFLSSATFLSPTISAIRSNDLASRTSNGRIIEEYMNAFSNYTTQVGNYINQFIYRDSRTGQIINSPELQRALMDRYRYGGINITPTISTVVNPTTRLPEPTISFLYSLGEDITLSLKQDQSYMDNDL